MEWGSVRSSSCRVQASTPSCSPRCSNAPPRSLASLPLRTAAAQSGARHGSNLLRLCAHSSPPGCNHVVPRTAQPPLARRCPRGALLTRALASPSPDGGQSLSGTQGVSSSSLGASSSSSAPWYDSLNRRTGIRGPDPIPQSRPFENLSYEEKGRAVLGDDGFVRWETLRKVERQRVWDHMRQVARIQFNQGTLPAWFNTAWLDIKEAPVNAFWREQGVSVYQNDDQWLSPDVDPGDGNGFAGGGGSSWGGGGFRWWREEDPYWPMRDWGDHPVRWWAFAFAAVLAVGGVAAFAQSGIAESLWWGFGLSSSLAVCAMGMSDMTHDWLGHLCVKGAWITCALLAAREYYFGWRHLRRDGRQHSPSLLSSGWAAVAMCGLLMWTGMSGLEGYALPDNPGSVFKSPSVAHKSRVWQQWGYGDVYMK